MNSMHCPAHAMQFCLLSCTKILTAQGRRSVSEGVFASKAPVWRKVLCKALSQLLSDSVYIWVCVCMYVCACVYIYMCIYIRMYVCMYVRVYTCFNVYATPSVDEDARLLFMQLVVRLSRTRFIYFSWHKLDSLSSNTVPKRVFIVIVPLWRKQERYGKEGWNAEQTSLNVMR